MQPAKTRGVRKIGKEKIHTIKKRKIWNQHLAKVKPSPRRAPFVKQQETTRCVECKAIFNCRLAFVNSQASPSSRRSLPLGLLGSSFCRLASLPGGWWPVAAHFSFPPEPEHSMRTKGTFEVHSDFHAASDLTLCCSLSLSFLSMESTQRTV